MNPTTRVLDKSGIFSQEDINSILKELKDKLDTLLSDPTVNRRVYSAAVECLDNVLKHSEEKISNDYSNKQKDYPSRFQLDDTGHSIVIYAGNKILNKNISSLMKQLEALNDLKPSNLNSLYKKKLLTAEISERGGAGLGLIIIAKIPGKKITYDFEKINNKFSYFSLKLEFNYTV